jgi:hypothetical protein
LFFFCTKGGGVEEKEEAAAVKQEQEQEQEQEQRSMVCAPIFFLNPLRQNVTIFLGLKPSSASPIDSPLEGELNNTRLNPLHFGQKFVLRNLLGLILCDFLHCFSVLIVYCLSQDGEMRPRGNMNRVVERRALRLRSRRYFETLSL